jgi:hypothetical protein
MGHKLRLDLRPEPVSSTVLSSPRCSRLRQDRLHAALIDRTKEAAPLGYRPPRAAAMPVAGLNTQLLVLPIGQWNHTPLVRQKR